MVKEVKTQMNIRENLRKQLSNWLHLQWGAGEGKEVSKVQNDYKLEVWVVGRMSKPLTEIEVRQGSSFVGMEGVKFNFR